MFCDIRFYKRLMAAIVRLISDTPGQINASSIFEIRSTTKGFLVPRMTQAERDAIVDPATHLLVGNTDTKCLDLNRGTPSSPDWKCLFTDVNIGRYASRVTQDPSTTDAEGIALEVNAIENPDIDHDDSINNDEFTILRTTQLFASIRASLQRESGVGTETYYFWAEVSTDGGSNWNPVEDSLQIITHTFLGNDRPFVISTTFPLNKDDMVRFRHQVTDATDGIGLKATAAQSGRPNSPSVLLSIATMI